MDFCSFLYNQNNSEIYKIGNEIAEGVGTSVAIGITSSDPDSKYKINKSEGKFSFQGNTWPIIDVSIDIDSALLRNPKITFTLLLEADQSSGTIVGTLKNIRADGEKSQPLEGMNNTYYIETEEGTEQVTLENGVIKKLGG